MARNAPQHYSKTSLPCLENAPKAFGYIGASEPPPSYRTNAMTETDTWSNSSHSMYGKRRSSWTNLVDSSENLSNYRVNHYPKVNDGGQPSMSRQSSQHTVMSDGIERVCMPKGSLPLLADPHAITFPIIDSASPSTTAARPAPLPAKRNRLQDIRRWCCMPRNLLIIIAITLVAIIAAVLAIVWVHTLALPKSLQLSWLPPPSVRTEQVPKPSQIGMEVQNDPERLRLYLRGSPPLKGNYVTYVDFTTKKVVVVDESLRSSNGRNLACFVFPLDTDAMPDMASIQRAASNERGVTTHQSSGWQQSWNYVPSPMNASQAARFQPPIPECANINDVSHSRSWAGTEEPFPEQQCNECHDFCTPKYGLDVSGNKKKLNLNHLACFHLFVPEWRSYATDNFEQNQRDFEAFYRNRQRMNINSGSRWIPLVLPPNLVTTPQPPMQPQPNFGQQQNIDTQRPPTPAPQPSLQNGVENVWSGIVQGVRQGGQTVEGMATQVAATGQQAGATLQNTVDQARGVFGNVAAGFQNIVGGRGPGGEQMPYQQTGPFPQGQPQQMQLQPQPQHQQPQQFQSQPQQTLSQSQQQQQLQPQSLSAGFIRLQPNQMGAGDTYSPSAQQSTGVLFPSLPGQEAGENIFGAPRPYGSQPSSNFGTVPQQIEMRQGVVGMRPEQITAGEARMPYTFNTQPQQPSPYFNG